MIRMMVGNLNVTRGQETQMQTLILKLQNQNIYSLKKKKAIFFRAVLDSQQNWAENTEFS